VLFASDCPFDPEGGPMFIRETIAALDRMNLSDVERDAIYWKNALKMLNMSVTEKDLA
jgi:aminocarboxymuconate-semialdehyde decarboxylase